MFNDQRRFSAPGSWLAGQAIQKFSQAYFGKEIMLQSRLYYFFTGFILVVWLVGSQANAQGVIDNFNRPNQDTPPAGWTAFRGEWGISEGSLAGESSEADGNTLREAWIWAGDPPVEMPSTMDRTTSESAKPAPASPIAGNI